MKYKRVIGETPPKCPLITCAILKEPFIFTHPPMDPPCYLASLGLWIVVCVSCTLTYKWLHTMQNHQPKNIHRLDLAPPATYVADVQLGLHSGPPTTGAGAGPDSVACLWNLFPWLGWLVWPQRERICPVLRWLDVPVWVVTWGSLLLIRREGKGDEGRSYVREDREEWSVIGMESKKIN